jgi:predicted amidohydrolase YtcJ
MHSAIQKGIHVSNHTDSIVTPLNQLFTCWTAVNRITSSGRVLGPNERITPYQALQAITMGSAYMCREEETKGSLKEGKMADLVILDKNPLKIDPMAIKDVNVLSTLKAGREVYHRNTG